MTNHTRELLLMVGESGSGKSTIARRLVVEKGYVRLNRDDLRIELKSCIKDAASRAKLQTEPAILAAGIFVPKSFKNGSEGRDFETFVSKVERARAAFALDQDLNVVVDNTHLNQNTVDKWWQFVNHKAKFRIYRMDTPMNECIRRDAGRTGISHVGRAVIERQFLKSGRHPAFNNFNSETKVYLFDIDGTTATYMDENGRSMRSPYSLNVEVDRPQINVIRELQNLYAQQNVLMFAVSGRKSTCGDATWAWLDRYEVPRDGLFMRHSFDNSSDVMVKREILKEILTNIPKHQIAGVIDDRPRVVRDCWMAEGLPVRPVYDDQFLTPEEFTTTHVEGCMYADMGYRRCPNLMCRALGDF